jgi:hypothetical protein
MLNYEQRADFDRRIRGEKEVKDWKSGKAVSMMDMKIKDHSRVNIQKMELNQTSSMLDVMKPTSSLLNISRKSGRNNFYGSYKAEVTIDILYLELKHYIDEPKKPKQVLRQF